MKTSPILLNCVQKIFYSVKLRTKNYFLKKNYGINKIFFVNPRPDLNTVHDLRLQIRNANQFYLNVNVLLKQ